MKNLLALLIVCGAVQAAPAPTEAAKLLAELPPQRALRQAQDMTVAIDGVPPRAAEGKSPEEIAHAREHIAKAKRIVPELRKLIRVGASVLDYPGLIARGDITWSQYSGNYEIYLGVYLRGHEGI